MTPQRSSLLLSVSRSSWAVSSQHGTEWEKHKTLTPAFKASVFERDNHTCQACGWRAERYQEIHHRDGDHSNHRLENLETLCPLCHQLFHLPIVAATNGGSIIWLPEISQETLNLLCVGIFVAMKTPQAKHGGAARMLFGGLEGRKSFVDEHIGKSDPAGLAQVLLNLQPSDYERRADFVGSLRLLPYSARFEAQIDYWAATAFKSLPENEWGDLIEGLDLSTPTDKK